MIALQENGVDSEEKKMLLLGAGGAAKAIAYQAAQDVEELVILNRTPEKAKKLPPDCSAIFASSVAP